MFEGVAEERQVELVIEHLDEATLPGRRNHLRQVLNNLLDNAIKFTATRQHPPSWDSAGPAPTRGMVAIRLNRAESGRWVELQIRDNGSGISQEDLPRIFERFYRADKSRMREEGVRGSGLGLSICRAIVESHHGTIEASSVPGAGTTMTVRLPLAQPGIDGSASATQLLHGN
jgi:signal transduction histidine kinase